MWPLQLRGPARQRMPGSVADWPGSSRTDLGDEEHRDLSTRRIPQRTDKQLASVHRLQRLQVLLPTEAALTSEISAENFNFLLQKFNPR